LLKAESDQWLLPWVTCEAFKPKLKLRRKQQLRIIHIENIAAMHGLLPNIKKRLRVYNIGTLFGSTVNWDFNVYAKSPTHTVPCIGNRIILQVFLHAVIDRVEIPTTAQQKDYHFGMRKHS
jgi:hypothetical protein